MEKKRVVVKIGSSSLTNSFGGLSEGKLAEHTRAIIQLIKKGHEVLLVSSGAVAAGFCEIGYPVRPVTVSGKQAAAAVGQGRLVQSYTKIFKEHGIVSAQLLLTKNDFIQKEQYNNAYGVLIELIKRSVLPIINENDSVSIEELTFGDNDMLSALVSGLVHADFLIILTDINGLYKEDPRINPLAERYDFLPKITEDLLHQTQSTSGSKFGTGGMKSKLLAAQTALALGVNGFIGTGSGQDKLLDILDGKGNGTYIGNSSAHMVKKTKQWLALHSQVKGKIIIDDGAVYAIEMGGKSLLPAGIEQIYGAFDAGNIIEVFNLKGEIIGKGQTNYSSDELNNIKGMESRAAMQKTGRSKPEVIHRDHFVQTINEAIT
ncbi:glutamate 5-kinase [Pseudalkalibacillus sp. A8]|uniref:glutamate 5-kinase n=1 Tax=Pseudalkalibacillus sp. A8 TaxID=3382641 RepID=UPI0038B5C315